jgi:hypothetical protein
LVTAVDEETRYIVAAAIREADRGAAEFEQWQAARKQQERAATNTLVVKDYLPLYEPPPSDPFNKKVWTKAIGIALSETRAAIRKQQADAISQLSERIDAVENAVEELAARLDKLEGNEIRGVACLDERLRATSIDNAAFVKLEYDGGMELLKLVDKSNGYAG